MTAKILEALWFFFPILAANQGPAFARGMRLPFSTTPVSVALLGTNKTWGAFYACPIMATLAILIQRQFPNLCTQYGLFDYDTPKTLTIALLMGFGAALGDHVKSFFKRIVCISPGEPWWPFDQLDFALGGMLASLPLTGYIGEKRTAIIIITVLIIHPLGNQIGYRLGFRSAP